MMELSVGKIRRSLRRFEDFAGDLERSDMNTFDDRLKLLMAYCKSDPVFSNIHEQLINMPSVNFQEWHDKVKSTVGGMVGSGDLSFPVDLEERMALMYQLLDRIDRKEIDLIGFAHNFFVTGDSRIDSISDAFNDAVVEPLARELAYRIEELEEELPEDSKEQYPLANIQIIHNAANVIQQSASGNNIQQNASQDIGNELVQLYSELRQELQSVISDKGELEEALQLVQSSEDLSNKGNASLPTVKVLLKSLGALGNVGSIVSSILGVVATIG